ncbi:acyl-CoA/acyl-ACP dehydrogenase [Actinoplanes sp. LDG1-06]|uniref:Acyl-CoA/acyl-ACP dehydrogenase n=1 Tax=Paractinoplanes ovalisporus TaxID=2810368 RepID=A0ABS2AKJ1_9ACTN|nr:acyl-CoA dehydrogenase family protein [Actinoplanes ovalisporus]MBM2620369.1 acyl-CoA/acyl-ACP dehydrogenase [Actinoplanes ovalisporus]
MSATTAPAVARLLTAAGDLTAPGAVGPDLVARLAATGALGAMVPAEHGGAALTHARYGQLHRVVAARSASLQSLMTVHGMVCHALTRSSRPELQALLPELARGELIAAFALSEQEAGSDIRTITTTARDTGDGWVLNGRKKWITFGAHADVFLVFAQADGKDVAILLRRDDPGVHVHPGPPMSGLRDAMPAELELRDCMVPAGRLLARPGTALTMIAGPALTLGRLSVAYGAWGVAEAACDAALARAVDRHQFGAPLHRLQLVRGLLSDAVVATEGAGLLCERAAEALDRDDEWATGEVLTAKLAASRAATTAATVAAQLHGAEGLVAGSAVDRLVGDARVMEVIEGSTQLLQHLVAEQALARFRHRRATDRDDEKEDDR